MKFDSILTDSGGSLFQAQQSRGCEGNMMRSSKTYRKFDTKLYNEKTAGLPNSQRGDAQAKASQQSWKNCKQSLHRVKMSCTKFKLLETLV